MKITRKQLRGWGACYTDARIATLVPADGLTPLEVAALDIPAEDRLWILLREEIIPSRDLRLLACDWAEAACRAAGWKDQRSLEAIAVARRFAYGEATEAELAAAASSSAEAARSSASWSEAAAEEAARLASGLSAAASASAARLAAGLSAAEAAVSEEEAAAAVRLAAAAEQIADVVRVLRKKERLRAEK